MGNGEDFTARNLIFLILLVIKFRGLRWAGHIARIEEDWVAFRILTDKYTGRRPLGRSRHRWEENIRICLKVRCYYKNSVGLA